MLMLGSPMCIDAVPSVALKHMTTLWTNAWQILILIFIAARTGFIHEYLLEPPTRASAGAGFIGDPLHALVRESSFPYHPSN